MNGALEDLPRVSAHPASSVSIALSANLRLFTSFEEWCAICSPKSTIAPTSASAGLAKRWARSLAGFGKPTERGASEASDVKSGFAFSGSDPIFLLMTASFLAENRGHFSARFSRMTLHQHIQKHWKTAAVLVVAGILAYSVSSFW
jgi:hypothetical protein